ncbi:MAG TPA: amino acid adenylation domain-containing protein [Gemmatimonadales bacterium]|nr:amino acid adenylation domain-containing protein [Gemmatimonadales bacterium]
MSAFRPLHTYLIDSAARRPAARAVDDPGVGGLTYGELDRLSERARDRLVALGVRPGDRVGVYLRKSVDAVAAIHGVLKAGAAYVPLDPGSPSWRAAFILNDCAVRALVVERAFLDALAPELGKLGADPRLLVLDDVGAGEGLAAALDRLDRVEPAPPAPTATPDPEALAYVLYTSGSTGKPKGVMLSHRAATSFVDWCSETFEPVATDRFSSHAPFHFDLSILDIYLPLKHGASLVLIGEELGKNPLALGELIAAERITIWYSTPSILNLLAQFGRLEERELGALRTVLFAGEVFPVPQLRRLKARLPHPRYFNLYGPTETNVCTWYEIPPAIPDDRIEPFPIGATCSHLRSMVVDEAGRKLPPGEEGELVLSGPGIMSGYWNLPERNAQAFLVDRDGVRWYRTGDLVVEGPDGIHQFHGRRDRMVKRRGYRIELGEIEAGLAAHPELREVAVVAVPDPDAGVRIRAFLSPRSERKPSLIELKAFCTERLPRYMVPDGFVYLDALPRTSTDKIDYQTLKAAG